MAEREGQGQLFAWLMPEFKDVSLADIRWERSPSAGPVGHSVAELGMMDAVLLRELRGDPLYAYEAVDGRRRLTQLEADEVEMVTAAVLAWDTPDSEASVRTVAMNLSRAPNPMQEAERLRELVEVHGYSAEALAKHLGIPMAVVRQRLRLASLPAPLREAVAEGLVAPGVASRVANLSNEDQGRCVGRLLETGKLRGKDVSELRQARTREVLDELPQGLLEVAWEDTEETEEAVLEELGAAMKKLFEMGYTVTDMGKLARRVHPRYAAKGSKLEPLGRSTTTKRDEEDE